MGYSPQSRKELHTTERLNSSMRVLKNVSRTRWPPLPFPSPRVSRALCLHRWCSTWTRSHTPAPAFARSWCQEPLRFLLCAYCWGRPLPLPTWGEEPPPRATHAGPQRTAHRRVHLRAVTSAQPNRVPRSPHPNSGSPHGSDTSPLCGVPKPFSSSWSPYSPCREGNME